ncbi:hypothetical protein [Pseudoxanthomonas composti]|uniref:hypothetical protein n=1 Tax=Pseudoxanthomonas composti TaxID=2137479 RepID=UPI0013E901B0|nr:hypothetical protein [Pseudoxanthomonas composti]
MWALLLPLVIVLLVIAASATLDQAISLLMHVRRRAHARQRLPQSLRTHATQRAAIR